MAFSGGKHSTVIGVYEPAMSRKMFEWSRRLKIALTFGLQLMRWYRALVPNSRRDEATKIAARIPGAATGYVEVRPVRVFAKPA